MAHVIRVMMSGSNVEKPDVHFNIGQLVVEYTRITTREMMQEVFVKMQLAMGSVGQRGVDWRLKGITICFEGEALPWDVTGLQQRLSGDLLLAENQRVFRRFLFMLFSLKCYRGMEHEYIPALIREQNDTLMSFAQCVCNASAETVKNKISAIADDVERDELLQFFLTFSPVKAVDVIKSECSGLLHDKGVLLRLIEIDNSLLKFFLISSGMILK